MDPSRYRIPLETAHTILATFGITGPTSAYERWVKEDGFDLRDFNEVLFESPFIFVIDWRCFLRDELETIVQVLARLDAQIRLDLNEDGESGFVASPDGKRARVAYRPVDGPDFDQVILALQAVVPEPIEFRADPGNHDCDTWSYAVLSRDEWEELERLDPRAIRYFFVPLRAGRSAPGRSWWRFW
jgi:hypothetical protein